MSFEIIKELQNSSDSNTGLKQQLTLVKLSRAHIAREVGKGEYVETDYVVVGASSVYKEDIHGEFHYEETIITASDEDGTQHKAILYLAPRALTVEEALFSLGETELREDSADA